MIGTCHPKSSHSLDLPILFLCQSICPDLKSIQKDGIYNIHILEYMLFGACPLPMFAISLLSVEVILVTLCELDLIYSPKVRFETVHNSRYFITLFVAIPSGQTLISIVGGIHCLINRTILPFCCHA